MKTGPNVVAKPAIGALLRLRFGLRGDRFWPEGDFGRFVSGPRNPVSSMQIDLRANGARGFRNEVVNLSRFSRSKAERRPWFGARVQLLSRARMHGAGRIRWTNMR